MNQQTKQAIQDAIDFLDGSYEAHKVRKALQEVLAQPAQEPVYAIVFDRHIQYDMNTGLLEIYNSKEQAERNNFLGAEIKAIDVLTHPAPTKEWVGLSDDERDDIKGRIYQSDDAGAYIDPDIAMLEAERILKEKNT